MMVMGYGGVTIRYGKRRGPDLSNAPLHIKKTPQI
jgi:hypothetical protein